MKTVTITGIMADFLDSIRAYEHESGKAIHFDERESSEFVEMYFNGGGKINIEESNADGENNKMKQDRKLKTAGQVFDEINGMRDGDIMEVYSVREGFVTKFQTGWTPPPSVVICPQCGKLMKFTGKALLSNPQQDEYMCEKCKHTQYRMEK